MEDGHCGLFRLMCTALWDKPDCSGVTVMFYEEDLCF